MRQIKLTRLALFIGALGLGSAAQAVDFSYSGFGNISAGKVYSSSGADPGFPDASRWQCPCYIADYSHASVYENKWSLAPESKIGFQGNLGITKDLSFTAQVMARYGNKKPDLGIEWAYLSYNLTQKLTLQAGRKRLPLFFYSDFQDVNYAYNWTRVPPDVYGWSVVNYNGANLTYRDDIAGWAVKSSFYVGQEHNKDALIAQLGSTTRQDVHWDNMMGIDLELNKDWFTMRLAHNTAKQSRFAHTPGGKIQITPNPATGMSKHNQSYSSLSINIDKDNWIGRGEYSKIDNKGGQGSNFSGYLLSGGYRIGKYLPVITYSRFNNINSTTGKFNEVDTNIGLTLRYQINDTSSFKVQYDRAKWDYLNGTNSVRKLATVSYDFTF